MRFKYYLRGIGIGVTLATLLLTISFYFGRDFLYNKSLTDKEIIEKASALGMVMPESTEEDTSTEESIVIPETQDEVPTTGDEFNKYLNKCKVDNLIQNGTFYVKQGSTYDDLVAVLVNKDVRTTTPPKN